MKQLVQVLRLSVLVAAFAFAGAAWGQLSVGYVDMKKVVDSAPQIPAAKRKLEVEFKDRDQEIVDLEKKLEGEQKRRLRDGDVMSEEERSRMDLDIRSMTRDLARLRDEFNEDFNIRFNEERHRFQERVEQTIKDLAKQRNLDLVLPDTSVLYAGEKIDITDDVVKLLQEESEAEQPKGE